MKLAARMLGALSALLLLVLLVGVLLPGRWRAEVQVLLPEAPSQVFPYLIRTDLWSLWTPMPGSGVVPYGPGAGVGAGLRWDDPGYGEGTFEILDTQGDARVEYRVEVEKGALRIRGIMTLSPAPQGTLLNWVEEGDFGWNPLLGYAARGMSSSQRLAMEASLDALRALLTPAEVSSAP